ncbi:MAG: EAL domain-containing protein [Pseudomonadota bacterium]
MHIEHDKVLDGPLATALSMRDRNMVLLVRNALKTRNVVLVFQPVVQARNANLPAFYEGLIRVVDDTGRVIPAKEFIHYVETLEEGRLLDTIALELGLSTLAANSAMRLSINMSARSIGYPAWERALANAKAADPTILERLILEITESSAMDMPDVVVEFMANGQHEGITFGLDDFGAGYTAFRYFRDFSFDMVKIDKSFIRNIHSDADNQVLTEALVLIARQFDMFTVAEGVERVKDAEYLIDSGIDCLQGFLFGAPRITVRQPEAIDEHRKRA